MTLLLLATPLLELPYATSGIKLMLLLPLLLLKQQRAWFLWSQRLRGANLVRASMAGWKLTSEHTPCSLE